MDESGSRDCSHTLSDAKLEIITTVRGSIGACCSIVCILILVMFCYCTRQGEGNCVKECCKKCLKSFQHRLLIYLTVATLLYDLMFVAQLGVLAKNPPARDNQVVCAAVGAFNQFTSCVYLLVVLWVIGCLTYNLQRMPIFWREILPLTFILLLAVIMATVPAVGEFFDLTEGWCWIRDRDDKGKAYQLLILLLLCFGVIMAVGSCIINKNRADPNAAEDILGYEWKHGGAFCSLLCTVFSGFLFLTIYELFTRTVHCNFGVWVAYIVISPIGAVCFPLAVLYYFWCIGAIHFGDNGHQALN